MSGQPLLLEQTIKYKTYLKRSLVEAITKVFQNHPDDILRQHAQVSTDNPTERAGYPAVVVRFYERTISNAGVGHIEWLQNPNGFWQPYKHYLYTGDAEFAIYTLSSYDREILADSITQIITMSDLEIYTNYFGQRIYESGDPDSYFNFININSDQTSGFGETQTTPAWMPEDQLVYQTSYRVGVGGEFYSRILETEYGLVEEVDVYPYRGADLDGPDPVPTGNPLDPAEWVERIDLTTTTVDG